METTLAAGWRKETGRTLTLALPMVGAYVAELGMWWTDQAIVGRLGADELAAAGLSAAVGYADAVLLPALIGFAALTLYALFRRKKP